MVRAEEPHSVDLRTVKHTIAPKENSPVVSKPLSAYDDNPVLDTQGAAFVLGVSVDLLKKWRLRDQGPEYIQYGKDGPIRYELKDLLDFRNAYNLHPKRYARREPHSNA